MLRKQVITFLKPCAATLGGVTAYSGLTYRRHGINTLIVSNLAQQDLAVLERPVTHRRGA